MTGSGMGCPDWPTCFGQWVPPTDISQLPTDYKTRFQVAGKEIADFDAYKTWVEYLNRLVGVLIGFLAILTTLFAWPLRKAHRRSWRLSLAGLALTIIQGGLGAIVVKTNLSVGLITLHMFFALMILACFQLAWHFAGEEKMADEADELAPLDRKLLILSLVALGLMFVQILLGTQVRETIDELAKTMGEAQRGNWLEHTDWVYLIHGRFYYLVVGIIALLTYRLKAYWPQSTRLKSNTVGLWAVLAAEVALGLGMHHFGMPAFMQPLHLLFAAFLFAGGVALCWNLWIYRKYQQNNAASEVFLQPA